MIQVNSMLFDLDGTLIDSRADLARSINLMLADLSRPPLDESRISSFVGDGVWVLVYRSLKATDPNGEAPDEALHKKGIELMRHHYSEQMLVSTHLFPNVADTLDHFSDKRIGLVTSKETDLARLILDHFKIARFFNCVVGGDQLPERKPDPKPVLRAMALLESQPATTVMIGDSENDVIAGKRAGTLTCGVTYGFRTEEQIRETVPDVIVNHFEQLRRYY
ncbi:MAG TPA: HAD-IA family hydrolase [Blastocatellia bacterium]